MGVSTQKSRVIHDMANALSKSSSYRDTENEIGVTTEYVHKKKNKNLSTQVETERKVKQDTSTSITHHNVMPKTKHICNRTKSCEVV